MDNQDIPTYFYGTMRGDGYTGLDADDETPYLIQQKIDTEFFSVINENKDR